MTEESISKLEDKSIAIIQLREIKINIREKMNRASGICLTCITGVLETMGAEKTNEEINGRKFINCGE